MTGIFVCAFGALTAPAVLANDSAYTDLIIEKCTSVEVNEEYDGAIWACVGHQGMVVRVAEGDLRFFISYGKDAANEMAMEQTLPNFNTINDKLEWRLATMNGKPEPIATILRFYTADMDGGPDVGEVLVVTQLGRGKTCHIAYVDARLNARANELAREAADTLAGNVDCATAQPVWMGIPRE